MAYRASRVLPALPAWLSGPGGLERAAERDALTPAALGRIFALGADVLTVEFEALTGHGRARRSTRWRGCAGPGRSARSTRRRSTGRSGRGSRRSPRRPSSPPGALRTLGARRLLQALKDDPRAVGLVFRPLDPAGLPALGAAAAARLDRCEAACRAAVEAASEPLGEGLWLARAAPGRTPAPPPGS